MSQRTTLTGPALVRLLARLSEIEVPESQLAFADRLSQWLGWTDAISLSAALDGSAAKAPAGPRASVHAEEDECARVRGALARAIAEDEVCAPPPVRARSSAAAHGVPGDPAVVDFMPYRLRYQARQQAMDAAIGPLRERLRARLAARSPALARLAAVDAVMQRVLGEHEHRLLAGVPGWLERHFERLRQAAAGQEAASQAPQPAAWLALFGRNVQAVLLAELDIRFQPVEGLAQALRKKQEGAVPSDQTA